MLCRVLRHYVLFSYVPALFVFIVALFIPTMDIVRNHSIKYVYKTAVAASYDSDFCYHICEYRVTGKELLQCASLLPVSIHTYSLLNSK